MSNGAGIPTIIWRFIKYPFSRIKYQPRPLFLLLYALLIVSLIFVYRKWTNIPCKTIDINLTDLSNSKDTLLADINFNLHLYESSSRISEINTTSKQPLYNFIFKEKIGEIRLRKIIISQITKLLK